MPLNKNILDVSILIELYLCNMSIHVSKWPNVHSSIYVYICCILALVLTLSRQCLPIGWGYHAELFGRTEASTVEEYWQVNDIPHVVMSVDVGVSQHTVEVLVDSFDDNMRVAGKDGDKRAFGEEHPHLE